MDDFKTNLINNGILIDNNIILAPNMMIDWDTFILFFGATDFSYNQLIAADDNEDGTVKGYRDIFNTWHSIGII